MTSYGTQSGQVSTDLDMNLKLTLFNCATGMFGAGGMRGAKSAAMSKPTSDSGPSRLSNSESPGLDESLSEGMFEKSRCEFKVMYEWK